MATKKVILFCIFAVLIVGGVFTILPSNAKASIGDTIILNQNSNVKVKFESSSADYNSAFGIYSPTRRDLGIKNSTPIGSEFDLGSFSQGSELIFFIQPPCGLIWQTGPASRNVDYFLHANVSMTSQNQWRIAFEDSVGGGDRDYNDLVLLVTATPTTPPVPPPPPAPICNPNVTKKCVEGNVYWFDSCNTQGGIFQNCNANEICSNGQCVNNCTSNATKKCVNGDVYWFDSCNNQGSLFRDCSADQVCSGGQCITNTQTIACSSASECGSSTPTGSLFCQGNSIYRNYTTWTCNNAGTANSYCSSAPVPQLQSACNSNQTCSNGSCSAVNTCSDHSYQRCSGSNLYWYDSCGNQQGVSQYCSNGCNSGSNSCNNYNYNTCTYHSYQRCYNNALYWYDSCGTMQDVAQYCANGCYNGACGGGNYSYCTDYAYKLCQGNTIYWYNSCGNQQGIFQTCDASSTCQNGQCVSNYNPYVYNAHYYIKCYGNNLYWYDAYGSVNTIYRSCNDNNSCTIDSCSGKRCENTLKCDGTTCQNGTADYAKYCTNNNNNNNSTLSALSISFLAKADANSTQWQKTLQMGTNGLSYFMISVVNNSSSPVDNVNISANIPGQITSLGNVQINGVPVTGDIITGINIGTISPKATKSVTFEGKTQSFTGQSTSQANALASTNGLIQTDALSIVFNLGANTSASISSTSFGSSLMAFLKRWYLWILVGLILIFLFIVVFRRLSKNS